MRRVIAAIGLVCAVSPAAGLAQEPVSNGASDQASTIPDDPGQGDLLFARLQAYFEAGRMSLALPDAEALVRHFPDHPSRPQVREMLSEIYRRLDRPAQSAAVDESLLEDGIGDPVQILARLALTYGVLGFEGKVQQTLGRLREIDESRVEHDPDLQWFALDALDRTAEPERRAAAYLRFANLFPDDPRRNEALLAAARSFLIAEKQATATRLLDEVIEKARSGAEKVSAQLLRAEITESRLGVLAAVDEYKQLLPQMTDPLQYDRLLRKLIDTYVEHGGTDAAMLLLTEQRTDSSQLGRNISAVHLRRLLKGRAEAIARSGSEALYFYELATRANLRDALTPPVKLAAASHWEQMGECGKAVEVYKELQAAEQIDETHRASAGAGIQRCGAGDPPPASDEQTVEQLVARADRLALDGDWDQACTLFRQAAEQSAHRALAEWIVVRTAECALLNDQIALARKKVETLLESEPLEPAAFFAKDLLEYIETAQAP